MGIGSVFSITGPLLKSMVLHSIEVIDRNWLSIAIWAVVSTKYYDISLLLESIALVRLSIETLTVFVRLILQFHSDSNQPRLLLSYSTSHSALSLPSCLQILPILCSALLHVHIHIQPAIPRPHNPISTTFRHLHPTAPRRPRSRPQQTSSRPLLRRRRLRRLLIPHNPALARPPLQVPACHASSHHRAFIESSARSSTNRTRERGGRGATCRNHSRNHDNDNSRHRGGQHSSRSTSQRADTGGGGADGGDDECG